MTDFSFYHAPEGQGPAQAQHDYVQQVAASGEAAGTGLRALSRYFQEKTKLQEERRQFDSTMQMRAMLAQQESDRYAAAEQGRNDRAQGALDAAAAKEARTEERGTQRANAMAQSLNVSMPRGAAENMTAGDVLGLANYQRGMAKDAEAQAKVEADRRLRGELRGQLQFGLGTVLQAEKVQGSDLYEAEGLRGAQGPEIQAMAMEMFPANPEMQKAWSKSMLGKQDVRYVDPQGWQQLLAMAEASAANSGADPKVVQDVAKELIDGGGFAVGMDDAKARARKGLDALHNQLLRARSKTEGGSGAGEQRAQEDQRRQNSKEDPSGLLELAAKSKEGGTQLKVSDLNEANWLQAEDMAAGMWSRDAAYVQARAAGDTKKASAIKRDFAKLKLLELGVMPWDQQAAPGAPAGAAAPANADAQTLTPQGMLDALKAAGFGKGG